MSSHIKTKLADGDPHFSDFSGERIKKGDIYIVIGDIIVKKDELPKIRNILDREDYLEEVELSILDNRSCDRCMTNRTKVISIENDSLGRQEHRILWCSVCTSEISENLGKVKTDIDDKFYYYDNLGLTVHDFDIHEKSGYDFIKEKPLRDSTVIGIVTNDWNRNFFTKLKNIKDFRETIEKSTIKRYRRQLVEDRKCSICNCEEEGLLSLKRTDFCKNCLDDIIENIEKFKETNYELILSRTI